MTGFINKLSAGMALALATSHISFAADDLLSAADAMCEHVKACSLAQITEADMTPEMRQMMEPMLDSMCDNMRQGVQDVPTGHALYQPAVACMRSMANLSCDDFLDESRVETPACKTYQTMAQTAYKES